MTDYTEWAKYELRANNPRSAQAVAMIGILELFQDLADREEERIAEEERTNRNGKWDTEWYVQSPPRKPVKFDSEAEAYAGAREARKALGPSAEINVFCAEVKRYEPQDIAPVEWEHDPDVASD